jgi:hypothetical protein
MSGKMLVVAFDELDPGIPGRITGSGMGTYIKHSPSWTKSISLTLQAVHLLGKFV